MRWKSRGSQHDNAIAAALLAKRNPVLLAAQAESRSEGLEEGRARGLEEGARCGLLAVLHARGLPITAAEQARIEACRDLDALTRWTARAVHAASVDEVLDDDRGETPG